MNKIIATSGIIFNLDQLVYITIDEVCLQTNENIVVTELGKTSAYTSSGRTEKCGIRIVKITNGLYDEIFFAIKKLQKELLYKEKYEELKLHLSCSPGGIEYLMAKEHFNETTSEKKTSEKKTSEMKKEPEIKTNLN